eukprot:TRINITY_DN37619_c0_g1_i1.p1 TRINITY_DN37619_c0_g1~~TRINITY_DN37619_c0_g1_i1.p1  ORF type:complete len:320 (-),score=53.86 TRINITY_DN37619_c0_g1_i1:57-1016(-)
MAPILVQPVDRAKTTLQLQPLGPSATVADLKAMIEEVTGDGQSTQRLVMRGRELADAERLDVVGLAAGGRVFLAVSGAAERRQPSVGSARAAVASVEEREVEDHEREEEAQTVEGQVFGSCGTGGAFSVLTRHVEDATGDAVRVCTRPAATLLEFKRDALLRLRCAGQLEDVQSYCFVADGQLLRSDGLVDGSGLHAGSRVVVVPPRRAFGEFFGRCRRRKCLGRLGARSLLAEAARAAVAICVTARSLPAAVAWWFAATWQDPWRLARPSERLSAGRPTRRIRTDLTLHPRTLRYGPGQNPHGEDLTMLFTQGILGGS